MMISLKLYERQNEIIDKLVEGEIFFSISEFLRAAILKAVLDNDFKLKNGLEVEHFKISNKHTSFRCPENFMTLYTNYESRTIFIRKAVDNLINDFEEKIF